ncbi:MAG: DUF4440 domain-containing protein [Alphaproteobacteria bacterium]|nr:DUF4440 domain-containing protein [Alphaproteobacteria bacterium]
MAALSIFRSRLSAAAPAPTMPKERNRTVIARRPDPDNLVEHVDQTSDQNGVLSTNEAFYRAFATRNYEVMNTVWATDAPVACIHPGWRSLGGREPVMASWKAILGSESAPDISCHGAVAEIHGDFAYVICYERVEGSFLVATNLFVRERGGWKMVHHQAGPTNVPDEVAAAAGGAGGRSVH